MRRFAIIAAALSALSGAVLVPSLFEVTYSNTEVWRGAIALTAHAIGIVPLNVIRILAILMAIHYVLELPKIVRRARQQIVRRARQRGAVGDNYVTKIITASRFAGAIAIKVAVPVVFYAVYSGGHDASALIA